MKRNDKASFRSIYATDREFIYAPRITPKKLHNSTIFLYYDPFTQGELLSYIHISISPVLAFRDGLEMTWIPEYDHFGVSTPRCGATSIVYCKVLHMGFVRYVG